jgi:hypothetical protein
MRMGRVGSARQRDGRPALALREPDETADVAPQNVVDTTAAVAVPASSHSQRRSVAPKVHWRRRTSA